MTNTVDTATDSVMLPTAARGLGFIILNRTPTKSIIVFPASGDAVNALAVHTGFAVASGKTAEFSCAAAGQWNVSSK